MGTNYFGLHYELSSQVYLIKESLQNIYPYTWNSLLIIYFCNNLLVTFYTEYTLF